MFTQIQVDQGVFEIPAESKKFETWKELEEFLAPLLAKTGLIRSIKCGGNSYSREACEYIAEIIKTKGDHDHFWCADFSNMFVSRKLDDLPNSIQVLVDAVSAYQITHLYMSDNAFGPNGVVKFNKQLATQFDSLTHLHLLNCGLGPEGTEMVADALIENGKIKLQELFISRNRVENKGAKALAKYFETYQQLKKLLIYQNGLEFEAFEALMPALVPSAQSGELTYLDISDNRVSDNADAVIAIENLL